MRSVVATATTAVVAAALILAVAAVAPQGRAPLPDAVETAEASITVDDLRGHLRFLASDELQGRAVGHGGNALAELYLATTFERIGLTRPDADYYQPFELAEMAVGAENSLSVDVDAQGAQSTASYSFGPDFYPASLSASKKVSAGLTFAGYGITAPDLKYDDYAGLDVGGRIVVVMQHEPQERVAASRFDGRDTSEHASLEKKIATAQARGAVGMIVVPDTAVHASIRDETRAWPTQTSPRDARYVLSSTLRDVTIPVAVASAAVAGELLGADKSQSLPGAQAAIDAALKDDGAVKGAGSFSIPNRRATLQITVTRRRVQARNVVGVIRGADDTLRAEAVVVGAHLDHDGIDAQQRVYNGADDDGSGTVSVIEVAEAFARAAAAGQKPRRTVVFALWNAEEKGLLGSRHYTAAPLPSDTRPVANVNLDMVGRNEEVTDPSDARFRGLDRIDAATTGNLVHLLGYSYAPDLAKIAQAENARLGLTIRTDYDHHELDLIRRSDHWSFLQRRIPAIFFTTGLHPDYHTPQDDVAKINFGKMEKIARLTYRVVWRIAALDAAPRFEHAIRNEKRKTQNE